jgi:3-phenylpropionate/trans-cinnamate dioxygenase ferredoxin reductase subunit
VLHRDPNARSFSIVYRKNRRAIALDCVSATKDYVQGRALVENGVSADPEALTIIAISLKDQFG